MRQQHYRFAHQVLMQEALANPAGWLDRLRSDGANALMGPWTEAGRGVGPEDVADPMGLDARPMQNLDGYLVVLPEPADTTECYFAALVRAPDGEARYFVAERTSEASPGQPRAAWAEWRQAPVGGTMRIRGQDLPSVTPEAFEAAVAAEIGVASGAAGSAFGATPAPSGGSTGGAFAGVAEGLAGGSSSGGYGAPPGSPTGGAFGGAAQPSSAGGAFGAAPSPPPAGSATGGAFGAAAAPAAGPPAGGAFGAPAQAGAPGAFSPPAKKKGIAGKLVGCGCLSIIGLVVLGGGLIFYLEEGVEFDEPGDEVKIVNVQPNIPFTFTYKWDGTNYASTDVWAVVDGTKDGRDFRLKGQIACARHSKPRLKDINISLDGSPYQVARREDHGKSFTAWFRVHDDYARASSKPFKCGGMITADKGTVDKVKIVVTQTQRPSDWIAF